MIASKALGPRTGSRPNPRKVAANTLYTRKTAVAEQDNRYGASLCVPQSNAHNLTLGLCFGTCLHTTHDNGQTRRPQHTAQTHNKYHHHGGGSVNLFAGMDLMNPCRPNL
jgi:hypothetical protein